jgi:hypothetical protein
MSDFVKIPTTPEVWAVIHASHRGRIQVYSSFSDPTGTFQGGPGERGVMDTEYSLGGTDYPILKARSEWDIAADGKKSNETHKYWLCVAVRQP